MRLRNGVVALFLGCLAVCGEATAQKKEEDSPPKAANEQLRVKVAKNVMQVFGKLEQPERIEAAADKFFEKERWDMTLMSFQSRRASEIHDSAHEVIKTTLPDIMQKFMPKYMQARIMAERKAKKAKGPPSTGEIAKIRADTMAKMKPVMQNTAMSALRKLTDERMDESLKDEKVLTRAMAEQMLNVIILPEPAVAKFKTELDKAGYPESLIRGTDPALNERVRKMLESIDIAAVAKEAGL
jgi:hypothetical protein